MKKKIKDQAKIEYFKVLDDATQRKNLGPTEIFHEMEKRFASEDLNFETVKKWLQRSGWNMPPASMCSLIEDVLDLEKGDLGKTLGYVIAYDHEDSAKLKKFFIDNIQSKNKALVYILIASSDKGTSPSGISIDELIAETPEIRLNKYAVNNRIIDLKNDKAIFEVSEGHYSIFPLQE